MSIDCIFKHTKEDALKDFIFFDEKTIPLEDVKPVILQPLQPTSAIIITGYIPVHAIRFSINLNCKTSGNIALHFNPRIDRGYVVRNTKIKGTWEIEETCSPVGPCNYIFRRNSYIHLMIFCTEDAFQIAINGEHFCAFTYRFPLSDIKNLECEGHIEDIRYNQLNLNVYPDPKIFKPSRSLSLTVDSPLVEFLEVPINVRIGCEFKLGTNLFIRGRLKLLPHSFYINLQKGDTVYPHPIIALHINPRFLYGSSEPYVVMNCWIDGSWKNEERHEGHLSWMPGRDFLLTIRCEHDSFSIWLGNKMVSEFKHRLKPSIINTLRISGDIVLYHLAIDDVKKK
ncbi:32 kDa beta-galactoside-binding lectin lec-3-like [Vespula maculifrons]|uniref:Galectin n=1 Tax=Vespula maculifrons TaxID=7453 RepID=A0ABD2D093_VESMC|nr:32 kDa beta-galactoside-binding lectin lec-3-like [Vespula vulgaris]XP_050863034.1 32 kDa beta-galactoside-binding lectin lec-3-like [Vespula vulgaris]XP_050863035.1 32 kDa beta-galactoside-binding lectin lec-3-like [Vespula vulgaris]